MDKTISYSLANNIFFQYPFSRGSIYRTIFCSNKIELKSNLNKATEDSSIEKIISELKSKGYHDFKNGELNILFVDDWNIPAEIKNKKLYKNILKAVSQGSAVTLRAFKINAKVTVTKLDNNKSGEKYALIIIPRQRLFNNDIKYVINHEIGHAEQYFCGIWEALANICDELSEPLFDIGIMKNTLLECLLEYDNYLKDFEQLIEQRNHRLIIDSSKKVNGYIKNLNEIWIKLIKSGKIKESQALYNIILVIEKSRNLEKIKKILGSMLLDSPTVLFKNN